MDSRAQTQKCEIDRPDSNVLCQYVHLQTNALHHSEKMDNREMREKSVGLTIACPDT